MFSIKSFILFLLAVSFLATAECIANKTTDSLEALLKKTLSDTSKVLVFTDLAHEYQSIEPEKTFLYARMALVLSEKISFPKGTALAYSRMGQGHKQKGAYDSAMYYFRKQYEAASASGNKLGLGQAHTNIGTLDQKLGTYDSSVIHLYSALKIAEELNDSKLLSAVYNNLGIVLLKQNKLDEAITHYSQALEIQTRLNNKRGIANAMQNLAICYSQKKEFPQSEQLYYDVIEIYESLNDTRGLAQSNVNLAMCLSDQQRFNDALKYAEESLRLFNKIGNPNGVLEATFTIAGLYKDLNDNIKARNYALAGLNNARAIKNRETEFQLCRFLQGIYALLGDYRTAYQYSELAYALRDSIFNENKAEIINNLQTKYETEKKEKEIQLLNKDNEIKNIAINKEHLLRNSLVGGTALIIIIGLLLFNRFRISQKQKHQAERVRISSDLHDEIGSTLSSISMYSAYAKEKPAEAGNILNEISSSSQEMIDDMNDIIWAINPGNDSFAHIIDRLRNYASRMAQSKNIALHFSGNDSQKNISLTMDQRKNFYLICKEALNNAVKYAECKNLFVNIDFKKNILLAAIEDDGKGFDTKNIFEGNGLKNMKYRADQIKANFSISSIEGKGTKASVEIKIS